MWIVAGIVVLALAGIVYQRIGLARDARRFPPPGRFVDTRGQRLHVVCRGSGTPAVIFESALATSSLSWIRVQDAVARFAATCAYDRAGFAWSDASAATATFDRTVDGLEAVAANAPANPPHVLVGHSFGVFVCMEHAARHPRDVAGLVLVDPPSDWLPMDRRQRRLLRGGMAMSRLGGLLARAGVVRASLALLTGGAPGATRHFVKVFGPTTASTLRRIVGEVRKLPEEIHPVVQAMWCQPKCFAAMADTLRMMMEATTAVSRITSLGDIPVVVISSGDQPLPIVEAHRALAAMSSRGRVVIAAESGHWIPYDEPHLIVDAIKDVIGGGSDGAKS
jgi:pimeloyl-ACP methyl ester carboxylesterase